MMISHHQKVLHTILIIILEYIFKKKRKKPRGALNSKLKLLLLNIASPNGLNFFFLNNSYIVTKTKKVNRERVNNRVSCLGFN